MAGRMAGEDGNEMVMPGDTWGLRDRMELVGGRRGGACVRACGACACACVCVCVCVRVYVVCVVGDGVGRHVCVCGGDSVRKFDGTRE